MYSTDKERFTYNELELLVIEWASKRRIIPNGKPEGQLRKLKEEVIELFNAHNAEDELEMQRELGDVVVTLINFCALKDFTLVDCLKMAYDKIKDRQGYTDTDGVFHKQE
jgi:uncharacterized protein YabN with tetrapyrrole methylase and pyrophosphatase domain